MTDTLKRFSLEGRSMCIYCNDSIDKEEVHSQAIDTDQATESNTDTSEAKQSGFLTSISTLLFGR